MQILVEFLTFLLVMSFPIFSVNVASTVLKRSRTELSLHSNLAFFSTQLRHAILERQFSTSNSFPIILSKFLHDLVLVDPIKSFRLLLQLATLSPHSIQIKSFVFGEMLILLKVFVGVVFTLSITAYSKHPTVALNLERSVILKLTWLTPTCM